MAIKLEGGGGGMGKALIAIGKRNFFAASLLRYHGFAGRNNNIP